MERESDDDRADGLVFINRSFNLAYLFAFIFSFTTFYRRLEEEKGKKTTTINAHIPLSL